MKHFDTPDDVRHLGAVGNTRRRYTFPNGYGASVIQGPYSYGGSEGLFELAVTDDKGHLVYDTPITDDVKGWLTEEDADDLLVAIAALPVRVSA